MPKDQATFITSVFFRAITWPFRWAFWTVMLVLMSWILAIAVGLLLKNYLWIDDANLRLQQAFSYLVNDAMGVTEATSVLGPSVLTWQASEFAYQVTFIWTDVERLYFLARAGHQPEGLDGSLFRYIYQHADSIEAVMWVTRIYGAKLALLITAMPLFFVAYSVATVDGLVLRFIRREGGGRESSFMYHRAKYLSVMLFGSTLLAVLLLPLPYAPSWVLPFVALSVGVLARTQWTYYKKYL